MMTMTGCSCWSCRHPTDKNAEVRVLHAVRHEEFEELLAAPAVRMLSRSRRLQVIAQEYDPDCAPVRSRLTGACLLTRCHITTAHPAHA